MRSSGPALLLCACTLITKFDESSLPKGDASAPPSDGWSGRRDGGVVSRDGPVSGCRAQMCAGPDGAPVLCSQCNPPTSCTCDEDADCACIASNWAACVMGACQECRTADDCGRNPYALGNQCGAGGDCVCAVDGDCAGNPNGPRCQQSGVGRHYCGCATTGDCTGGAVCSVFGAGFMTCYRTR